MGSHGVRKKSRKTGLGFAMTDYFFWIEFSHRSGDVDIAFGVTAANKEEAKARAWGEMPGETQEMKMHYRRPAGISSERLTKNQFLNRAGKPPTSSHNCQMPL